MQVDAVFPEGQILDLGLIPTCFISICWTGPGGSPGGSPVRTVNSLHWDSASLTYLSKVSCPDTITGGRVRIAAYRNLGKGGHRHSDIPEIPSYFSLSMNYFYLERQSR